MAAASSLEGAPAAIPHSTTTPTTTIPTTKINGELPMSATSKIVLSALVSGALAISAYAPAAFADQPERLTSRVSYGDLNMSAPAGGRTLLARIEGAAMKVCNGAIPRSPVLRRSVIECRRQAIATSVQSLGFTTLTVAWNGKYAATVLAAR